MAAIYNTQQLPVNGQKIIWTARRPLRSTIHCFCVTDMAASSSALLTLFALVFAGPLFYLCRYIYRRVYSPDVPKPSSGEKDGEEIVSSASYMLGLVGYAVGIGNVWRFPYLVGKYGGGAFVFAYLVCLFLIAMPLYFVELGLGQHSRCGAIDTFSSTFVRCHAICLHFMISSLLFMLQ